MKKIYDSLPHTADIKIKAYGSSLQELFCNALKGMFLSIEPLNKKNIITLNTIPSALEVEHEFTLKAPNKELLLIDFLNEALYLSDINNEAYFDVQFSTFSEIEITGSFFGMKINGFEVVEIKAVTYSELKIEKIDEFWQAIIVFDI